MATAPGGASSPYALAMATGGEESQYGIANASEETQTQYALASATNSKSATLRTSADAPVEASANQSPRQNPPKARQLFDLENLRATGSANM